MPKFLIFLAKTLAIAVVIVFIGSYIFFCPRFLAHNFSDQFLLFPMKPDENIYRIPSISKIKKQDVYFRSAEGNKLHGWIFENPDAQNFVIFTHGNAGNIGHRVFLVKALLDAGASVFIFDYAGYGLSNGTPTLPGSMQDTEAAYDFLHQERKIPAANIIIYGESIGGAMATNLIKTRSVAGIILDSTFTNLFQIARIKVPVLRIYPDFMKPEPNLDVKAAISAKHPPLLVIHGRKDEIIPYTEAEENFAAASEPKQMLSLANSTHNSKAPDFQIYCQGLKNFFAEINKRADSTISK